MDPDPDPLTWLNLDTDSDPDPKPWKQGVWPRRIPIQQAVPSAGMAGKMTNLTESSLTVWSGVSDLDPDPDSEYGSGSGSTDLIENGYNSIRNPGNKVPDLDGYPAGGPVRGNGGKDDKLDGVQLDGVEGRVGLGSESGSGFRIWIRIRIHWPDWIWIQTGSGSETLETRCLTSTDIQQAVPSAGMAGKMTNLTESSLTVWSGVSDLLPAQYSRALMFFTLGFSFFTFGDKNKRAVTQSWLPIHESSVVDPDS
jgi:hypothetical protein